MRIACARVTLRAFLSLLMRPPKLRSLLLSVCAIQAPRIELSCLTEDRRAEPKPAAKKTQAASLSLFSAVSFVSGRRRQNSRATFVRRAFGGRGGEARRQTAVCVPHREGEDRARRRLYSVCCIASGSTRNLYSWVGAAVVFIHKGPTSEILASCFFKAEFPDAIFFVSCHTHSLQKSRDTQQSRQKRTARGRARAPSYTFALPVMFEQLDNLVDATCSRTTKARAGSDHTFELGT